MIKPARATVAMMALAASTLVGIAVNEGYRSEAYIPVPGDVPTIGFGHTEGVKIGDKTTPVRSLQILLDEIDVGYVQKIKKCIHVPLYMYEFSSFVSLSYNIGAGAFCSSTLVKKLNQGDYAGACAEISRWNRMNGKVLAGLTKRREEERAICEGRA